MAKVRKFALFAGLVGAGLCIAGVARGQNPSSYYIEDPRTFYGGVLVGGNFSQVDGDNYAGYHKVGLNVGGIVYTHLAEHLAVSLEILFSQKGAKGNQEQMANANAFMINKYQTTLNYAEIPVQLCQIGRAHV